MAFNFLGTIESIEDFEEFEEFVLKEQGNISKRIRHLTADISRNNELLDKFKIADLALRGDYKKSDQADANWTNKPRSRENLRLLNLDGLNGIDVDNLKKTFLDTIKFKRERNEFKIKRIRDLKEQLENEISFLELRKEDYQDNLDRIRGRFDIPDFVEVQKVKDFDSADVEIDIRAIPKDAGKEVVDGVTYYVILNIDSAKKSISFEYTAPPVARGDRLRLSGGLNNKVFNVMDYANSSTLIVNESLVDESPSRSRAVIEA